MGGDKAAGMSVLLAALMWASLSTVALGDARAMWKPQDHDRSTSALCLRPGSGHIADPCYSRTSEDRRTLVLTQEIVAAGHLSFDIGLYGSVAFAQRSQRNGSAAFWQPLPGQLLILRLLQRCQSVLCLEQVYRCPELQQLPPKLLQPSQHQLYGPHVLPPQTRCNFPAYLR